MPSQTIKTRDNLFNSGKDLSTICIMRGSRIVVVGLSLCILVLPNSSASANSKNLCGTKTKAVQCQGGKGGTGNGFFDPNMNPKYNPNVNPKYNPMADPKYNPMADPKYNPMADPRYNPGAKPCDLGISNPGKSCPKR